MPPAKQTSAKPRPPSKLAAPDERILTAINHPIRFAALNILTERVASANVISKEIGETVGAVAYHVRLLRNLGAIELVETVQRRGAVESYYRATVRPWFSEAEQKTMPARQRRALVAPVVQRAIDGALRALTNGGFDHKTARSAVVTLDLDAQGQRDAADLLDVMAERLSQIAAESAARANGSKADMARREVATLLYEPTPAPETRQRRPRASKAK